MGLRWEEVLDVLREVFPAEGAALEADVPLAKVHGVVDLAFTRAGADTLVLLGYFDLPEAADLWLQRVLQLNFAYMAEHGESLSWDREKKRLCVARRLSLPDETEDALYLQLESFIAQLEFWAKMASSLPLTRPANLFSAHF